MYDTRRELLDGFRDATVVIQTLLRGCSQAEAAERQEGDWSILEVVCHLRDCEERALERMRVMRDEAEPFIPAFDQDQWVQERNYAAANLEEALAGFVRFRETYLVELAALAPEAWERAGEHEEQGRITIQSHGWHHLCHDIGHAAQLARHMSRREALPSNA